VLLLAGCDGGDAGEELPTFVTPPRANSPVQTDALDYTLDYENHYLWDYPWARATYVNTGDATLWFGFCRRDDTSPTYFISRAAPDGGDHAIGPTWACGGPHQRSLAPGETLAWDVYLGLSSTTSTMRERTGLFRIFLHLYLDESGDTKLPRAQRQSNLFQIHPPAGWPE
jgi:hypothetical protein